MIKTSGPGDTEPLHGSVRQRINRVGSEETIRHAIPIDLQGEHVKTFATRAGETTSHHVMLQNDPTRGLRFRVGRWVRT